MKSTAGKIKQIVKATRFGSNPLLALLLLQVVLLFFSSSSGTGSTGTMALSLQGKRVLVTGGGRGIGQAIALICQQEGAKVAISSRTESELQETAALAKSRMTSTSTTSSKDGIALTCDDGASTSTSTSSSSSSSLSEISTHVTDATNPKQVKELVQQLMKQWGGIDILINNAGMAQKPKGPIDTLSLSFNDENDNDDHNGIENSSDYFTKLLQLNVVALHTVTSAVLSLGAMPKSKQTTATENDDSTTATANNNNNNSNNNNINGRILNISSKAGKVGLSNYSLYVASKFAVEGLTSSWSKELARHNIVVNSLSPGMVDTKSFPKIPPNKPGVRAAESIKDCLLVLLTQPDMDKTGHYVHVDEFDLVRSKGLPDDVAFKPIDEIPFQNTL